MSHYFTKKQESPVGYSKFEYLYDNRIYSFITTNGVFSKGKVDFGTNVLVNYMIVNENDKVLDLGCGIGIVGRICLEKTKNKVFMVDMNERAVEVAKKNVKMFKNVEIKQSDIFEKLSGEMFDVILLNPPQTAGKKVCLQMIKESKEHLVNNGSLQVVARHNKGGETFSNYMKEIFGNVDTLAKKGGYRVYISRNLYS